MSGRAPVLDDLTRRAQDLGRDQNEQQRIRVEENRWVERSEEARERDTRRKPGISDTRRLELDQLLALIARRLRIFRIEDGDDEKKDQVKTAEHAAQMRRFRTRCRLCCDLV